MAWKGVHLTKPRGSRLPTANAASSRMTVKSAIGREPLVRFGPTISPIKTYHGEIGREATAQEHEPGADV